MVCISLSTFIWNGFVIGLFAWLACKSGLVLKRLLGDKPDIKKLEESVRSLQTEGVVWGACKLMDLLHYIVNSFFLISSFISIFIATIVKLGYGFKYLRIIFTIVDDLVCFKTVLQKTGGIHLKRICKYLKSILLTSQNLWYIYIYINSKDGLFCT